MTDISLTPRDVDILRMLSQGRRAHDIALSQGVPVRHMRRDIRDLRERLSARTNIHAVVIAVRQDII